MKRVRNTTTTLTTTIVCSCNLYRPECSDFRSCRSDQVYKRSIPTSSKGSRTHFRSRCKNKVVDCLDRICLGEVCDCSRSALDCHSWETNFRHIHCNHPTHSGRRRHQTIGRRYVGVYAAKKDVSCIQRCAGPRLEELPP